MLKVLLCDKSVYDKKKSCVNKNKGMERKEWKGRNGKRERIERVLNLSMPNFLK